MHKVGRLGATEACLYLRTRIDHAAGGSYNPLVAIVPPVFTVRHHPPSVLTVARDGDDGRPHPLPNF